MKYLFIFSMLSLTAYSQNDNQYKIQGLYDIGYSANNLGYYDIAINAFSEALILDSMNLSCIANRAYSYNAIENYELSIQEYTKAIGIKPYQLFHNMKGLSYGELGLYEKAIDDFDSAIEMNDSLPYAYYNKGRMLYLLNQIPNAISYHQTALSLVDAVDERADMLNSLAKIYFDIEDYQNSLKLFKEIITLNYESSFTYLRIGDINRRLENTSESIDAYDKAINYSDVSPLAYLYRGKMKFMSVDDWDDSKTDLQKYIELVPEDPEGYSSLGGLLWFLEDPQYCDYLKMACERGECMLFNEMCK